MRKPFKVLLGVIVAFAVTGWIMNLSEQSRASGPPGSEKSKRPPPKELNMHYGFSEGWLMNHDFYVTNTCGEDLTEVRLKFVFIGENASPSLDRYWAKWALGEKHEISIPVERVTNVQRITVSGRADQGVVEADLTPAR